MAEQTEQPDAIQSRGTKETEAASLARRKAVALKYDPSIAPAPKVMASGRGTIAEQILELAKRHNVPVRADPDLAEALVKLEIGQMIPPQLYMVIAEVFAWLYRLNEDATRK